ncbi:MAG: hypothetical protein LBK61_13730, partial [Spirochaetaceae bacterium]|nr:hypothetical protein [Spirochaetaceae bacterium]
RFAAIISGVLPPAKPHAWITSTPKWVSGFASGGAGPPQVDIDRASGGTLGKPGFLRSKKCAQMKSLLYPLVFYK